jgi:hypothetical protein
MLVMCEALCSMQNQLIYKSLNRVNKQTSKTESVSDGGDRVC